MNSLKNKRVAIVCDWIKDWGGAELVLSHIMEVFPDADIFSSIFYQDENPLFQKYNPLRPSDTSPGNQGEEDNVPKIHTSFIQKIPLLNKSHKLALTLRPQAFEGFDLSQYDIVISSSSAESKGVITKPDCLHICYCHTPTRYFWSHYEEYLSMMEFGILNPIGKWLMPKIINKLRRWDYIAAQRPDYFIANSRNTQERIKKYYKRDSEVIYPSINISEFPHPKSLPLDQTPLSILSGKERGSNNGDYYLAVGRCIPYKKFDLLVDAFNKNGKKLIIATNTDNKLYRKLRKISKDNIEWKMNLPRSEIIALYSGAKAFVFPPEEDFGLVPVEAQACGTPVIAYGVGGALETVVGVGTGTRVPVPHTGIFFDEQTPESLNKAIEIFESMTFDRATIRKHAEQFDVKIFQKKLVDFIEGKYV